MLADLQLVQGNPLTPPSHFTFRAWQSAQALSGGITLSGVQFTHTIHIHTQEEQGVSSY